MSKQAMATIKRVMRETQAESVRLFGEGIDPNHLRRKTLATYHSNLTDEGVPRSINGSRLGLRKRLELEEQIIETEGVN